jgi:hypothetical protein
MMPAESRQRMSLRPAKVQVQESTSHADASFEPLIWLLPVMAIIVELYTTKIALSDCCNAL